MDQNENKESSLAVATSQPPELPTQPQKKKAVIFPPPDIPQLDETDSIIAVAPTVFNSIFEVGALTTTSTSQATSTATTFFRSIARLIAHARKQAAPLHNALPLNASSADTVQHQQNYDPRRSCLGYRQTAVVDLDHYHS